VDPAARAKAYADEGRARQAANRAKAPTIAAWWDDWFPRFGMPDALSVRDPETGHLWKRGELARDTGRSMNADEWLAYVNDPNPRPLGFPMERK